MSQRDLFVVVADLDAENVVRTLLENRQAALRVKLDFCPQSPPRGDLLRYAGRDSGCYKDAVDVLRTPQQTHRHALLIFDKHGCGAPNKSREEIEAEIEGNLQRNGWPPGKAAVIVIEPELESWVWATSPRVADALGWRDDRHGLVSFLASCGHWDEKQSKPSDPKEAMRQAMRHKKKPLGAPVFSELALKVSVERCQDGAFQKFRQRIMDWFPLNHSGQ